MSKELSASTFDYSKVDKDTRGKLIAFAGQVKRHSSSLKDAANEIGKVIFAAHELLAEHKAGLFDEWVELETEVSLSTAYNYINVEKRAFQFPILENLPPTVAYMLAGPKVPDAAIEAFEKRIEKGEKATIKNAKETLNKFRKVAAKSKAKRGMKVKATEPSTEPDGPGPDGDDPNEHVRQQIENERATGDINTPAPGKVSGGDTFDPKELEAAAAFDASLAGLQKPYDEMLNALTKVRTLWNQVCGNAKHGVYAVEKRTRVDKTLDELRAPIAQARPEMHCQRCEGKGCEKCRNCGWWPKSVVHLLAK